MPYETIFYLQEFMKKEPIHEHYHCGRWNRLLVNKIFLEQPSPEPKVKVMIPMYEPLETSKREKCSFKATGRVPRKVNVSFTTGRGKRVPLRTSTRFCGLFYQ